MVSHSITRLAHYVMRVGDEEKFAKTKPEVILSNIVPMGGSADDIITSINYLNRMRRTNKVLHIVISHPNKDMARVTQIGEEKILSELVEGLQEKGINLNDTAWAIVRHEDKDNHIDYHLVAASTDREGRAVNDSYIGRTAMYVANNISKKYGLSLNHQTRVRQVQKVEVQARDYSQSWTSDILDAVAESLATPQPTEYEEEQAEIELQQLINNAQKARKKKRKRGRSL